MISDKLIDHYRGLLSEHGPTAKAVHWADSQSQNARFSILAEIADPLGSVLDFGCGLGDLLAHLRQNGFGGRYCGVDIVPEFVAHVENAFDGDVKAVLDTGDLELPRGYDFAMLSGVFNNRMDDNRAFMEDTIRRMWNAAGRGIAFNAMSSWVDYQDPDLWYVDPLEVFAFCKGELGANVVLRHDYVLREGGYPFEFAIYAYRDPVPAGGASKG